MDALDRINESLGSDCGPLTKECRSPSLVDNLTRKKKGLELELANVNAALDALGKNPEVANVLELVCRAR